MIDLRKQLFHDGGDHSVFCAFFLIILLWLLALSFWVGDVAEEADHLAEHHGCQRIDMNDPRWEHEPER